MNKSKQLQRTKLFKMTRFKKSNKERKKKGILVLVFILKLKNEKMENQKKLFKHSNKLNIKRAILRRQKRKERMKN